MLKKLSIYIIAVLLPWTNCLCMQRGENVPAGQPSAIIIAGTTWSYTETLSDERTGESINVTTHFVFTSPSDVIWLFGTPNGHVFPVGFGKYNSSTGEIKFSSSEKLHKNISLYYGEYDFDIVFLIDFENETAKLKSSGDETNDNFLKQFYNKGMWFLLSKNKYSFEPNGNMVGSRWEYNTSDGKAVFNFKTWNEVVIIEDRVISVPYCCFGNMVCIKSGDNLVDENLIGFFYGNELTLRREGLVPVPKGESMSIKLKRIN